MHIYIYIYILYICRHIPMYHALNPKPQTLSPKPRGILALFLLMARAGLLRSSDHDGKP